MHRLVRTAAAVAVAGLLAACGRSTGDFGRAEPNVLDDRLMPAFGDAVARHVRDQTVSDFRDTDRELTLRDRAWALVRAPHADDWLGDSLVEFQRTRVLPEIDSRFDPAGYYAFLRREAFRSSEARWARLIVDMRSDAALIGPFWREAKRVHEDDRLRLRAVDGRRDVAPQELRDAYARIDENARVADWVWRSMRFRLRAYRMAIDRLMVETPSDRLYDANLAWNALAAAIAAAERDVFTDRGTAARAPRASRYARGAGIREVVPQK